MQQRTLFEAPPRDGLHLERRARRRGFFHVAGVDEVGRGPLAGPVVAAAVILPERPNLPGVTDSKKLSAPRRQALVESIYGEALSVGIGLADPEEIDRINILQASFQAMVRALSALDPPPDFVLVDGPYTLPLKIPHQGIRQGDAKSLSIGAASIVAKVYRDRLMDKLDELYPQYGFKKHKGYPTRAHREALRRHGPSPVHRLSFKGVREHCNGSALSLDSSPK
ncbi:RNase HII [Desulfacinum hydrothermale DSM 13146]|uniref:Ribonuclease HII n=1 Tax=Desulfacinum hydrothermale DSM 13146 TaxID=1121390 RepID=A0A1W1XPI2_9BACT|nr:ribonuclease HII [Desulfacinum hydrothermale]SMC25806.1 RNase HII [Desulfacinum hydrothermale DSM 13146]